MFSTNGGTGGKPNTQNSHSEMKTVKREEVQKEVFRVVYEEGDKQILQIQLQKEQTVFFKGKILYTTDYSCQHQQLPIALGPLTFLNFPLLFNQLRNTSQRTQVIGAIHTSLQGPFLLLDAHIYQQDFYINYLNIVASTTSIQTKKSSQKLNHFKLLKDEEVRQPEGSRYNHKVALQSNGPIIEKYLGDRQQFVIYDEENILAYSKEVVINRIEPRDRADPLPVGAPAAVCFQGPGWIFFTTRLGHQRRMSRKLGAFNLCIILSLLSLVFIIFIPLI